MKTSSGQYCIASDHHFAIRIAHLNESRTTDRTFLSFLRGKVEYRCLVFVNVHFVLL